MINKIRTVLSAPFAVAALALMSIALWILPKPKRLKIKETP